MYEEHEVREPRVGDVWYSRSLGPSLDTCLVLGITEKSGLWVLRYLWWDAGKDTCEISWMTVSTLESWSSSFDLLIGSSSGETC